MWKRGGGDGTLVGGGRFEVWKRDGDGGGLGGSGGIERSRLVIRCRLSTLPNFESNLFNWDLNFNLLTTFGKNCILDWDFIFLRFHVFNTGCDFAHQHFEGRLRISQRSHLHLQRPGQSRLMFFIHRGPKMVLETVSKLRPCG